MVKKIFQDKKGLFFLAGGVICLFLAWLMVSSFSGLVPDEEPTTVAGPLPAAEKQEISPEDAGEEKPEAPWVVYITGAIAKPGVYEIHPDSRVFELVEQAGGLTSRADTLRINLAMKLQDGVHVHVPALNESGQREDIPLSGSSEPESMADPPSFSFQASAGTGTGERIDINRADAEELQTLPGIGPKTAASIIQYRSEHGCFSCPEELIRVKGIGEKKLEKLKTCIFCDS